MADVLSAETVGEEDQMHLWATLRRALQQRERVRGGASAALHSSDSVLELGGGGLVEVLGVGAEASVQLLRPQE